MGHRLALVFDDLLGGGTARVATTLGNTWAAKGWPVCAMTCDDGTLPPVYSLHPGVDHWPLALRAQGQRAIARVVRNLQRVRTLRSALRRAAPDVIISFLDRTNVLTILATRGLGIPLIICERTDPAGRSNNPGWEALRRITYPWADALVCQGLRPLRYFPPHIQRRGRVIPNPVALPAEAAGLRAGRARPGPGSTLVALGNLRPEKGYDLLLLAFARLAARHPGWSLVIWGEGPLRPMLEAQARSLGIAGRVRLPGSTREPFARLAEADLYVLSSRVEGFPNALTEAMSVGLPVIASDVGAVSEIVRDGMDGLLVPPGDVAALARAMDRLMSDDGERRRLATRAPDVLERFGLEKVIAMWEELIVELADGRSPAR